MERGLERLERERACLLPLTLGFSRCCLKLKGSGNGFLRQQAAEVKREFSAACSPHLQAPHRQGARDNYLSLGGQSSGRAGQRGPSG